MGYQPQVSVVRGETMRVPEISLREQFELRLRDAGASEDTAIIYEEGATCVRTSYGALNAGANRAARLLAQYAHRLALAPNHDGDYVVAVCMQPSDKLLTTLLAVWKAGMAYLPLDSTFPEQRVKHILGDAKPILVIYDHTAQEDFFIGCEMITVHDLIDKSVVFDGKDLTEEERFKQNTENLAIVLYTSGSTGVPKGVRLPHNVINNRVQWQYRAFPYGRTEHVCVFKTALTFVDAVAEIWAPLAAGRALLVLPKQLTRDPCKLVETLSEYQVERLVLVPTLLRSILMYLSLKSKEKPLLNLRLWVCSGEILTVELTQAFFNYFTDGQVLCNFYGSTEIMGDVTYYTITSMKQLENSRFIPIGKPVDNTIIYLLDEQMEPVRTGQPGELWVAGLNLAAGYVNGRDAMSFIINPHANNKNYSRLYKTGDYARLHKDNLVYEGRTDSQIKIRGHRVELTEVEKVVSSLSSVDRAVVLCYKPGEMDQQLLAFVTPKDGKNITGMFVEGLLQNKLTAYMIPQVIVLDNIPLLVNGKVDRQSLLKIYENTNNNDDSALELDIDYTGIPSEKLAAAEVLFHTVGSVIGRSTRNTLSLKSNFYELGGNSLNSIYTITQLRDRGYYIEISDFLSARNLGEVLECLSTSLHDDSSKDRRPRYTAELLEDKHKAEAIEMITRSFYEKADLERWLKPAIKEEDFEDLLTKCWECFMEDDICLMVRSNEDGRLVGITLNFDAHNEPDVEITSALRYVMEFLEHLEGPIRETQLPQGKGQILHSFMMATHEALSPQENVCVIQFMEEQLVELCRRKNFAGILTTNTSPLTQQLGRDVMGYEILLDYQVNQFLTAEGEQIFAQAPDDQRAMVSWKPLC